MRAGLGEELKKDSFGQAAARLYRFLRDLCAPLSVTSVLSLCLLTVSYFGLRRLTRITVRLRRFITFTFAGRILLVAA
jgi:hypothetical protein